MKIGTREWAVCEHCASLLTRWANKERKAVEWRQPIGTPRPSDEAASGETGGSNTPQQPTLEELDAERRENEFARAMGLKKRSEK